MLALADPYKREIGRLNPWQGCDIVVTVLEFIYKSNELAAMSVLLNTCDRKRMFCRGKALDWPRNRVGETIGISMLGLSMIGVPR